MMRDDMLNAVLHESVYQLKEGTASSYYWQSGSRILSNRASISQQPITAVRKKGRMLQHLSTGQFVGTFTKSEESPFKIHKPYCIRTQIWLHEDYPQFLGYGTIGISDFEGKIVDTGDLLIFYSSSSHDWKTLRIFVLMGMGKNPDTITEAMNFVTKLI